MRAYDPQTGQLASVSGPQGITLAYGRDGALLTSRTWSGAGYPTVSVQQGHDSFFRVNAETVNGGSPVSFGYDDDGLLTQAGGLSVSRDPLNGRVTGSTLGGVSDTFTYDAYGQVASYTAQGAGTVVFAVSYVRDDLGRIVQKTEAVQGQAQAHVYDYAYDLAGRLIDVLKNGALFAHYDYDANGNRLARTTPQGSESGVYDAQDRVTSYGTKTYGFTAAGELAEVTDTATGAVTSYGYDANGNLRQVILPGGSMVEYVVDGENHRVWKKKDGVVVQGFVYRDALQPVAELDAAGSVVARFVYASGRNVPEVMVKGGATYRLVTDHLGSVRLVVDVATGAVAQRMDYDEYGRVLINTAPGFQPFGFAGGLYDGDTNLVRFGARDFDPDLGRWTAKDPLRFGGGDTNLYGYVLANPINLMDWTGTSSCADCAAAGVAALSACVGAVAPCTTPVVNTVMCGGAVLGCVAAGYAAGACYRDNCQQPSGGAGGAGGAGGGGGAGGDGGGDGGDDGDLSCSPAPADCDPTIQSCL